MKNIACLIGLGLVFITAQAQIAQSLSLEDCYTLARQNYPLTRQRELILQSQAYSVANAAKGYLPQFQINGQASYQSDVTKIPIQLPGMEIPTLSKDQYRLYGEANQVLFDGGLIRQKQAALAANAVVETQKLEVELYILHDRINQLFFGILLVEQQVKQNDLYRQDIQLGIRKTEAAIANGTALKSSLAALKAELLRATQRTTELKYTRQAYIGMLGLFVGQNLNENTTLIKPENPVVAADIRRPEIALFRYQSKSLDLQDKLRIVANMPRFYLFFQGGIGRPALNMLSNALEPYALGGIRLNWSLAGFYTSKKEKALVDISRQNIDLQKETFLFNTQLTLQGQHAEITKLQDLLTTDEEMIVLRVSIKKAAAAQLENDVITSSDYVREVNAEDGARQSRILHEIQLLQAQYNQKNTAGY